MFRTASSNDVHNGDRMHHKENPAGGATPAGKVEGGRMARALGSSHTTTSAALPERGCSESTSQNDYRNFVASRFAVSDFPIALYARGQSMETSATLADLFMQLLFADLSSAVRASKFEHGSAQALGTD